MKKIFIIGLIIALVIILLLYFFSSKNSTTKQTEKTLQTQQIEAKKNFEEKIYFPFIVNGKTVGLLDLSQYFYFLNLTNLSKEKIFPIEILDPKSISYSPSGNKAIVVSFYPEKNIKLYDFKNKMASRLSPKIDQVEWSEEENKIFYSFRDEENAKYQINYANPDGSDWHTITDKAKIGEVFEISADGKNVLIFDPLSINYANARIFQTTTQEIIELDKNLAISKAYWSPDSNRIAVVDRDNKLFILDQAGKNIQDTQIEMGVYFNKWHSIQSNEYFVTNKILWQDNKNLVIVIPNDLQTASVTTPEDIYIYNTSNQKMTRIKKKDQGEEFTNINLVKLVGQTLYFTSDDFFYKIELP